MKKCLILGAGGFMGKSLCRELSKNCQVIAYDLFELPYFKEEKNIECVQGDFCNTKDFSQLLNGVDIIYHLISTTVPNSDTSIIEKEIQDNVMPTVRLLEAVKDSNVKKVIFASSAGTIYGFQGVEHLSENAATHPECSYGVQKKIIESYLEFYGKRYGVGYTIARISNPYGFGQMDNKVQGVIPIFIRRLLNDEEITLYGNTERDYIFIEDVAEALACLCNYQGEQNIFNICAGKVHSLWEVVELIQEVADKKFCKINVEEKRVFDLSAVYLDNSLAKKELNWQSHTDIKTGILKTVKFYEGRNNENV